MKRSRLAALAALATTTALAVGVPLTTPAQAAPAGPTGAALVLGTGIGTFTGLDVATDQSSGAAYVGWISSGTGDPEREVHLCVLPAGATACAGGVLETASLTDWSTAAGLHVVVTSPGHVSLVWYHTSATGHLTSISYAGGPTLGSAVESTVAAPVNGSLEDVQLGPDGQLWAVTEDAASISSNVLTVRDGLNGAPTSVPVPFSVSKAQLAFNGSQPILAFGHGSDIGYPVKVASGPGWGVSEVAGSWQKGTAYDIVGTSSGARMVASEADAGYFPVSLAWSGSTFAGPVLTGDKNNCSPVSHDLVTDPSGRIADVTTECEQIAVTNMGDTRHAAVALFPTGGTVAGPEPQIGSFARGNAWVAWGIQVTGGDQLQVAPVELPTSEAAVTSTKKRAGTLTLTGPSGCAPAAPGGWDTSVGPKAKFKAGKVKVTLDGRAVAARGSFDGATLSSGSSHRLLAKVTLKPKPKKKHHHGHHRALDRRKPHHGHHGHHGHGSKKTVLTASLTFQSC
jgi:hypothetical protein